MWWAYPGRPDLVGPIAWAVVIATVGAEMSIVFNNAQLPNIVRPERMGWLCGFGWGMGYFGGLIALGIVLRRARCSASAPEPLFGLARYARAPDRPASALWLAIFVLPMFLFTPDCAQDRRLPLLDCAKQGGRSLVTTVRKLRHYRNALTYLIAFMLYNDGLAAIIAFGGVYASATFGWPTMTLGIFGIILTVFAIPGAFMGGKLDDLMGSKRTVQLAIAGVIIATIGIVGVTADRVLFVIPADPLGPTRGLFGSAAGESVHGLRPVAGLLHGADAGGQPHPDWPPRARRHDRRVHGLFALSGRATAWMAPTAIGLVTAATNPIGSASRACCSFWCWVSAFSGRCARSAPRPEEGPHDHRHRELQASRRHRRQEGRRAVPGVRHPSTAA